MLIQQSGAMIRGSSNDFSEMELPDKNFQKNRAMVKVPNKLELIFRLHGYDIRLGQVRLLKKQKDSLFLHSYVLIFGNFVLALGTRPIKSKLGSFKYETLTFFKV